MRTLSVSAAVPEDDDEFTSMFDEPDPENEFQLQVKHDKENTRSGSPRMVMEIIAVPSQNEFSITPGKIIGIKCDVF